MYMNKRNLIAISYAKQALVPGSREYLRMQSYANLLDSYHVVVFTRANEQFPAEQHVGSLHLYATNARTRLGMLWRSYVIGRAILKQNRQQQFVVSSQDPFETSLVGRALARTHNATHHVQIHGDVFNPASFRSSVLQRLRAIYGRYVVARTPAIRVVSDRIKQSLLAQKNTPQAVTVLPVQADLSALLQIGTQRVHTDQPLQLLFLGRLAPEKQIPLLLQACVILRDNCVDFHLNIVGAGPQEKIIAHAIERHHLGSLVTCTPWVSDISTVMQTADILCLTSAHEGWGMVLLEAAAAGLAIVSTDVGCIGECLVDKQSVLVANTASEFADALTQLQDVAIRTALSQTAHLAAEKFACTGNDYIKKVVAGYFTESN
jgi:glycosyltransferase involved in cell wall biosynthesis